MAQADKIDKIIAEVLSEKFEEWKPFLDYENYITQYYTTG